MVKEVNIKVEVNIKLLTSALVASKKKLASIQKCFDTKFSMTLILDLMEYTEILSLLIDILKFFFCRICLIRSDLFVHFDPLMDKGF